VAQNEFESGGTGPARKWGRGHQKNFVGRAPSLFDSKSTISRFGERFRDGQYSLVSLLLAVLLTVPHRVQPFVKVGGGACALWSRRHCRWVNVRTVQPTVYKCVAWPTSFRTPETEGFHSEDPSELSHGFAS